MSISTAYGLFQAAFRMESQEKTAGRSLGDQWDAE